tara:strand:+ start:261 stop:854 length:594 start_codon:yes stop_codon:yes gene_type:complete
MATKLTKLGAVNIVLSNIGQAPVTALATLNPAAKLAEQILDEVSLSTQAEGWVFNTEQDYPFTPNSSKEIIVPANVIALDFVSFGDKNTVLREGKLYDKRNHTYQFDDIVYGKVTWVFDFIDLPEVFKNYIAMRAANVFANRSVGSNEIVKYSKEEEQIARAAIMEYETQQGDYNMLNDRAGGTEFHTYLPFNAIKR